MLCGYADTMRTQACALSVSSTASAPTSTSTSTSTGPASGAGASRSAATTREPRRSWAVTRLGPERIGEQKRQHTATPAVAAAGYGAETAGAQTIKK
jgi:hypothetical protein